MLKFNRIIYGILFSSIIAWTIYILTIDFYALTLLTYGPQSVTTGPIPIKLSHLSSLTSINLFTLLIITISILFSKIKCQNLFD